MSEKQTLQRQSSMSTWFHDKEKGTWLGTRDAEGWTKIIGFYLIYYSFLVGFWAICFSVLTGNLPEITDAPVVWRESPESDIYAYAHILTGNPMVYPTTAGDKPDHHETVTVTCDQRETMKTKIDDFLNSYSGTCAAAAKAHFTDKCGADYGYGASSNGPCLFIKTARTWNWPKDKFSGQITCHWEMADGTNVTGTGNKGRQLDMFSYSYALAAEAGVSTDGTAASCSSGTVASATTCTDSSATFTACSVGSCTNGATPTCSTDATGRTTFGCDTACSSAEIANQDDTTGPGNADFNGIKKFSYFDHGNKWTNQPASGAFYAEPVVGFQLKHSEGYTSGTRVKIQCDMPNVDQGHLIPDNKVTYQINYQAGTEACTD